MELLDKVLELSQLAVENVNVDNLEKREVFELIPWEEKIVGLYGLRWVWKTTILVQKYLEYPNDSVYISMDWWILKWVSLFEIVKELYKVYKKRYFFIDEIHYYSNWTEDLKNIYDLLPVKLYFSGSNKIAVYRRWADLSRRVIFYYIPIFSFREYLNITYWYRFPKLKFEDIFDINNYTNFISKISINQLKKYFRYWQFWFYYENPSVYELKLYWIIRKMLYEDGLVYEKFDVTIDLEKILYYISNSVHSELSLNSLGKKLGIHPVTVQKYLLFLEEVGLVYNVKKYWNLSDRIRKEFKPYLTATNFLYLYYSWLENTLIKWKVRENFFVMCLKNFFYNISIFYKTYPDFVVEYNGRILNFEIWGISKKQNWKNVFIVKDDILIWRENILPLWIFWFLW